MAQITGKELSALGDLLDAESIWCAKYKAYAAKTDDAQLKDCYERMAQRHQQHFDQLYANLK